MSDMSSVVVLGRLIPCQHAYCFTCIRRWTCEESHECPLCKVSGEEIEKVIRIPLTRRTRSVDPPTAEEVDEVESLDDCKVCGSGNHPERLLLCDSCGGGTHTFCLSTPRITIPPGQWFCADCRNYDDVCKSCGAQSHYPSLKVVGGTCEDCVSSSHSSTEGEDGEVEGEDDSSSSFEEEDDDGFEEEGEDSSDEEGEDDSYEEEEDSSDEGEERDTLNGQSSKRRRIIVVDSSSDDEES